MTSLDERDLTYVESQAKTWIVGEQAGAEPAAIAAHLAISLEEYYMVYGTLYGQPALDTLLQESVILWGSGSEPQEGRPSISDLHEAFLMMVAAKRELALMPESTDVEGEVIG